MAKDLNKDTFKEFYKENKLCLIDFWAPWCGPCRMLGPVLEELGLPVGKINVDEEEEIAYALGIQSIPAVFLFKDGNLVDKSIGFKPKQALIDWIKKYE